MREVLNKVTAHKKNFSTLVALTRPKFHHRNKPEHMFGKNGFFVLFNIEGAKLNWF